MFFTSNRPPEDCLLSFPNPFMANLGLDQLGPNNHHFITEKELKPKKMRPNSSTLVNTPTEHIEGQTAQ